MEESRFIDFIRRHLTAILLVAVGIIALLFAAQYGFVQVNVAAHPGTAGEYTYYITDTSNNKTSKATSADASYKRFMHRGTYMVTATQGETTYFSIVKSKGFFLSKKVEAKLASENNRVFVGDNPDSCMKYIKTVLLSYSCNGQLSTLKVHKPATANTATYIQPVAESTDTLEGIVEGREGSIALLQLVNPDGGDGAPQLVTPIDENGKTSLDGKYLDNPKGDTYHIGLYRDGYAIHDGNLSDVRYYSSYAARPEIINIERPKGKNLEPYLFTTTPNSIIVAFNNNSDRLKINDEGTREQIGETSITVYEDGKSKQLEIPGTPSQILGCGTKKLCAISNKSLYVYDVAGKSAKLLYSLPDVQAIATSGDKLLVAAEVNVLSLDVDKASGSVAYSYGEYRFCGIEGGSSDYTLCLINPLNNKVALHLDVNLPNMNSIDKKVLRLQNSTSVKQVSIYQNNIFVLPNYGNPVAQGNSYDYDPAIVTRMNATFAQDLAASGIDTKAYTVSGILAP